jgi:tRNA nucleotidyltransferase/poly(A) polymerase
MKHETSVALMKFLSEAARRLGVAEHTYIVGGAVRNFLIDQPIKDLDVVIDSVALNGKDSEWFAKELQRAIPAATSLVTNQYGVAILTIKDGWSVGTENLKGEVIEIANARKESYSEDPSSPGKGYKPHTVDPATIEEDLVRREFTFNTLLWRLLDLEHGPERAEVLDLTGLGKKHLEDRILSTPVDPDKTFSDDPTRMLRAIKFVAKYGFKIPPDVLASIRRNAQKLKQMPWDAVRKILTEDILEGPSPRKSVELLKHLGLADVLKEMLHETPGFAAALGRSLTESEIHLLLDLLDLGWAFKTPVSFLDRNDQLRLREILLGNAEDPAFEKAFVAALVKPPVDQQRLFTEYAIPPKERQVVTQVARRLLIDDPTILTKGLGDGVEAEIAKRYPRASLPERVAAKFSLR